MKNRFLLAALTAVLVVPSFAGAKREQSGGDVLRIDISTPPASLDPQAVASL